MIFFGVRFRRKLIPFRNRTVGEFRDQNADGISNRIAGEFKNRIAGEFRNRAAGAFESVLQVYNEKEAGRWHREVMDRRHKN